MSASAALRLPVIRSICSAREGPLYKRDPSSECLNVSADEWRLMGRTPPADAASMRGIVRTVRVDPLRLVNPARSLPRDFLD
jgi:hypothetical protein